MSFVHLGILFFMPVLLLVCWTVFEDESLGTCRESIESKIPAQIGFVADSVPRITDNLHMYKGGKGD